MNNVDLVGPEAMDPLRESDFYVQPFQNRGQFADAPARIAAFECFVLRCLDSLQTHPELKRFGVSVSSKLEVNLDCPALPKIIVHQKVALISEGAVRPLVNVKDFYTTCFPFSGVWAGEFTVSHNDERARRYFAATASNNHDERRCMLVLLSAQAAKSFSAPELDIQPE